LPEGEEVLVPFASALLLGVDLAAKSIRMTLPEGLAEINRASEENGEENG
jgi:ribosomal 30S subunit maturation factor RimM